MWKVALIAFSAATMVPNALAATYYVRQTVGKDTNDGTAPEKAWEHIARLSMLMHAGDTVYIGPGLYREEITVVNSGEPDKRITFIADSTGQHTGDPPGVVMITGAEPVDESIFQPSSAPGVYSAQPNYLVGSVVEMDGDQYRYHRARDTKEHLIDKLSELDTVRKLPSSFWFDEAHKIVYIHTSDGKPPPTHEIELIRRGNGISLYGKHYVTIVGFTFRHMGDAGIVFFRESSNVTALNNTSYGSRQGIRVYNATKAFIYGNTLFRNDNSGVYFALRSADGWAVGNTCFENIKGVRWSSQSVNALAVDNILFDNHEAGVAIEDADGAIIRGNSMANNAKYQLMVERSAYSSENNCFETRKPEQIVADFVFVDHYKTLADYQRGKHQDLNSREGRCRRGEKVDVHRLHAESTGYTERARKILAGKLAARRARVSLKSVILNLKSSLRPSASPR